MAEDFQRDTPRKFRKEIGVFLCGPLPLHPDLKKNVLPSIRTIGLRNEKKDLMMEHILYSIKRISRRYTFCIRSIIPIRIMVILQVQRIRFIKNMLS